MTLRATQLPPACIWLCCMSWRLLSLRRQSWRHEKLALRLVERLQAWRDDLMFHHMFMPLYQGASWTLLLLGHCNGWQKNSLMLTRALESNARELTVPFPFRCVFPRTTSLRILHMQAATCTWCLAFSPFMLDGGATFSLWDMASSLHASIIHICNGTLFVRAMSHARKTPCRFWLLALYRLPLACMLPHMQRTVCNNSSMFTMARWPPHLVWATCKCSFSACMGTLPYGKRLRLVCLSSFPEHPVFLQPKLLHESCMCVAASNCCEHQALLITRYTHA